MSDVSYSPNGSYIEWRVIIAGTVLACAVSAILVQFGAAVGLAQIDTDVSADANITPGGVLAIGIWLLWVQVLSALAGSYLAGRMRTPLAGATEHERDLRDGVHGLLVWATSTLAVGIVAYAGAFLAGIADPAPVEKAKEIADVSTMNENAAVIFAFFAASSSLATAVISWWIATVGGDHRDTSADHTRYFTFRVLR